MEFNFTSIQCFIYVPAGVIDASQNLAAKTIQSAEPVMTCDSYVKSEKLKKCVGLCRGS